MGMVQHRRLHSHAGEGREKHRKELSKLFPLGFCSDIPLGTQGRNSSGRKAYNEAFTLPEQIEPKPCARGKHWCVPGLEAA